jgi:hypothetical protein
MVPFGAAAEVSVEVATPSHVRLGKATCLTIQGTGFQQGATVGLRDFSSPLDYIIHGVSVQSGGQIIICDVSIRSVTDGATLQITNPDGSQACLPQAIACRAVSTEDLYDVALSDLLNLQSSFANVHGVRQLSHSIQEVTRRSKTNFLRGNLAGASHLLKAASVMLANILALAAKHGGIDVLGGHAVNAIAALVKVIILDIDKEDLKKRILEEVERLKTVIDGARLLNEEERATFKRLFDEAAATAQTWIDDYGRDQARLKIIQDAMMGNDGILSGILEDATIGPALRGQRAELCVLDVQVIGGEGGAGGAVAGRFWEVQPIQPTAPATQATLDIRVTASRGSDATSVRFQKIEAFLSRPQDAKIEVLRDEAADQNGETLDTTKTLLLPSEWTDCQLMRIIVTVTYRVPNGTEWECKRQVLVHHFAG